MDRDFGYSYQKCMGCYIKIYTYDPCKFKFQSIAVTWLPYKLIVDILDLLIIY